ncbi:TSC22 domain family protein 3 isoform X2 [Eucyclogobius newberryi]|uniref:TSC22 domain family protein 3 isoform X2 n=1 Tax=Eucyclogobius newberryi TaxID=166745 RepID=UPI003B59CA7D
MSEDDCRSPIGLDCCSCCLDLANGIDDTMGGRGSPSQGLGALPGSPTSPTVTHFRQLRHQLMYQNVNRDKLNNIMRQDSLESVVRDPCFLLNEGICNTNTNIDQTMLSILLYFHRCFPQLDDKIPARVQALHRCVMFIAFVFIQHKTVDHPGKNDCVVLSNADCHVWVCFVCSCNRLRDNA